MELYKFKDLVWSFYRDNQRTFPWRETRDPYCILVSEIMLQQTQTYRVEPKYRAFIERFPTVTALAQASFVDVLGLWKGLGYNRRAKALHACAQMIEKEFNGVVPTEVEQLLSLPGIGPYTSNAILTFAYNKPNAFIETNIRSVFIAHFFAGQQEIHDKEIFPLIEQTVDQENPREWYYALMDYGVHIKKTVNPNHKSKHYTKQSKFEGSNRQVRGNILELLLQQNKVSLEQMPSMLNVSSERFQKAFDQLLKEGLIVKHKTEISLNSAE